MSLCLLMPSVLCIDGFGELGELGELMFVCRYWRNELLISHGYSTTRIVKLYDG